MSIVLYTKVNAQRDKPATVVGRTKKTTLAVAKLCVQFGTKFQREVPLFVQLQGSVSRCSKTASCGFTKTSCGRRVTGEKQTSCIANGAKQ